MKEKKYIIKVNGISSEPFDYVDAWLWVRSISNEVDEIFEWIDIVGYYRIDEKVEIEQI